MTMHIDPPSERRPLPLVELAGLDDLVCPIVSQMEGVSGTVLDGSGCVRITLYSDSPHLRRFFAANWGGASHGSPITREATIVALRGQAKAVPPQLKPGVRYVNPERTTITSLGSEYYGNIKVSVRGLCSAAACATGKGGFLHGAALSVDGIGLVIGGTSGAGKTTTMKALFGVIPDDVVHVVNDDWGWADHGGGLLKFTGEPHLHMKFRSVRAIAPHLEISPRMYLSENYSDDPEDAHGRLLISRQTVFNNLVADVAPFRAYIVLLRDHNQPFFVRHLEPDDVKLLEAAEYSAFYDRNERFLDGSLLLCNEADVQKERERFRRLLMQTPSIVINNVATPAKAAGAVKDLIDNLRVQDG